MDASVFDSLARSFVLPENRRVVFRLLGNALAFPALGSGPAKAKKKKKKLLKSGATPGECPPVCTPSCPGTTCGGDDGCGGTCVCAAGSLCHSGVCHPCDITCNSGSAACDDDLKTALTGGGAFYVCPGRYVGNFTLSTNVALIGAGGGEDPAANTILDGNGSGRVLEIEAGVNAALHGLRITGGYVPEGEGGGIFNHGTLTLTACTVDKNEAEFGGGILTAGGGAATINGSTFTGNVAQFGGGLFSVGTVSLDSASSVTGNSCTASETCGGGIYNQVTVTLNGANVSGNTPDNCVNVTGC